MQPQTKREKERGDRAGRRRNGGRKRMEKGGRGAEMGRAVTVGGQTAARPLACPLYFVSSSSSSSSAMNAFPSSSCMKVFGPNPPVDAAAAEDLSS